VHAGTQGQSAPVFTLATLFGFDLVPRISNFRDLIFFRASKHLAYAHIDELFGERGRNVIDWKLIERHWQDLMQVAISISEGRLSSATLMRRLRSNSRKNRISKVFREVGRSVRTVALMRYLADPHLRARITAATDKAESCNGFAPWLSFGNNGVLADNDPAEQEKLIKLNTLLANLGCSQGKRKRCHEWILSEVSAGDGPSDAWSILVIKVDWYAWYRLRSVWVDLVGS
jgi:TnpA family transposase